MRKGKPVIYIESPRAFAVSAIASPSSRLRSNDRSAACRTINETTDSGNLRRCTFAHFRSSELLASSQTSADVSGEGDKMDRAHVKLLVSLERTSSGIALNRRISELCVLARMLALASGCDGAAIKDSPGIRRKRRAL